MTKIERIYRQRRHLLISAFVCSCLLFFVFCFWKPFSALLGANPWRRFRDPLLLGFEVAGVLAAILLAFLFARYVLFKTSTLKDPALRRAVDDERIRQSWLRAYRAAFCVMVGIHLVYLFMEGHLYEWGLPHAAWVSSTAGLMTFFGSALFYTREAKNENP